jgi:hypothetical protein
MKDFLTRLAPLFLIVAMVSVTAAVQFSADGEWALAVYRKGDPVIQAAPYVTSVADRNEKLNAALVHVETDAIKQYLRASGAFLIDPKGLPLCQYSQVR